jgi:hypothetical protein
VAVVYLEPEDEITGAVARLRAMSGGAVVMVVPAGSRVATSRINFRLLAREARQRKLQLAVVSGEPAVRALAAAADVPAHASVEAAESALAAANGAASGGTAAGGTAASRAAGKPVEDQTDIVPVADATATTGAATTGAATTKAAEKGAKSVRPLEETAAFARPPRAGGRLSVEPPLYDVDEPRRRRRRPAGIIAPVIAIVLLLVLVSLALYAAYLFVPTATITLQPKLIDVGPLTLTVTADPRVAVVDANAGLVPASEINVPLTVSGTFDGTGTLVSMTAAKGSVRFSSKNTVFEVPVPAGTIVSTANGIDFQTTDNATVPRANFDTQQPGTVDVDVVAVEKGPRGNVNAGAIKKLPDSLNAALVSVRNPDPTSGGERIEATVVTQSDYDAALAQLTAQLEPKLASALADPATTPHGLTLYPTTARLGPAQADQAASDLVNQQASTFDLSVSATATVLAVNEGLIDQVAQAQLNGVVPAGTTLLSGTVKATHSPGTAGADTVVFNASAAAKSWRSPDTEKLISQVAGLSVTDAQAIMDTYGSAQITIWPDFIDRLPDQNRIRLDVVPPQETP